MDTFLNPRIYKNESVHIEGMFYTGLYFKDDRDRDWYETLTGWAGAIAVNESDIVCACESDVSMMGMAEGRSVYEVDPADVPQHVVGNFKYKNGVFIDIRPDEKELAGREKAELLLDAAAVISPLQDAVDLGIATNKEAEQLLAWKKYRVLLSRVDVSVMSRNEWPQPPVAV